MLPAMGAVHLSRCLVAFDAHECHAGKSVQAGGKFRGSDVSPPITASVANTASDDVCAVLHVRTDLESSGEAFECDEHVDANCSQSGIDQMNQ